MEVLYIPQRNGEDVTHQQERGGYIIKLRVKRIDARTYFAEASGRSRWGNYRQIREDIEHWQLTGSLPKSPGPHWQ